MTKAATLYTDIRDEIEKVLVGNEDIVEGLTIALLTDGHVLLEGLPGVAKTTIARLFARATGMDYRRIQMTPDILPADITGTSIYRQHDGEFEIKRGPVFTNIVVADEINRAPPKTQSALLEAMQERQVTIDGKTLSLPTPFLVVATQNPIDMRGTFEMPRAQQDRFQFKLTVRHPNEENEIALMKRFHEQPRLGPEATSPVVDLKTIEDARAEAEAVHVDESLFEYVRDIIHRTRTSEAFEYGASPRAALTIVRASKARAALKEREFVVPEDVTSLAEPILAHRLGLAAGSRMREISVSDAVEDVVESVSPPSANAARPKET